jgi:hypothetical protein
MELQHPKQFQQITSTEAGMEIDWSEKQPENA